MHNVQKGQTTQSPKEKGQTTQSPKDKGQTTQSPKEKGQTTQSPKKKDKRTTIYKTYALNPTKNQGCSGRVAVPIPLVAPVVLI